MRCISWFTTGYSHPGKSLWIVWNSLQNRLREHAHARGTSRAGRGAARRPAMPVELGERARDAPLPSSRAASSRSVCAPPSRLRHDPVDHAELEAVRRVGLERRGRLLRLPGVAPEDRGAALGRDHRVDRVLLHQHAVGDARSRWRRPSRPRRSRTATVGTSSRAITACERAIAPPWPCCSAATPGIGARRVDERDEREADGGRRAPSRASPCGSPPGTPCRSCASSAPSMSRPFWWPISAIVRPSNRRSRSRSRGRRARPRSPCSSTKSSRIRST